MRRRPPHLAELAVGLAVVVAVAGCGSKAGVLSDSTRELDRVHSGVLTLKVMIDPAGGAGKNPFGFELKGPFTFGAKTLAHMTYTQMANGKTGTATFVLGANGGYVEANGTRRPLTRAELVQFRGAAKNAVGGGGLNLDAWATSLHQETCGEAVCVSGNLDPAKAIMGLTQLERQVGSSAQTVKDSPTLEGAVRSSRYTLVARKSDKMPQRITMTVDFHKTVPLKLRRVLGSYVGAKVIFDFALARANENVSTG
jgi:hypothetical protein